jgi:hypothetical protein
MKSASGSTPRNTTMASALPMLLAVIAIIRMT